MKKERENTMGKAREKFKHLLQIVSPAYKASTSARLYLESMTVDVERISENVAQVPADIERVKASLNAITYVVTSMRKEAQQSEQKLMKQIERLEGKLSTQSDNTEKKIAKIYQRLFEQKRAFTKHYEYWRAKRITAIVEYYSESWFKGKKILELGCGYGDIGFVLTTLGAEVVFAEGRKENCDYVRERFPNNRVYQMNAENEWPFSKEEKFDMILHMGLLYHMDHFEFSLDRCLESSDILVLETEVCDSDDPDIIIKVSEDKNNVDQSLIGIGSRPAAAYVERYLEEREWQYDRVTDARCNAGMHEYDWNVKNTKTWKNGMRRFWFCEKTKSDSN